MKWPDKETDAPIKPYNKNRCKLTNSNSAINPEKQARLYAEWALKKGLTKVHTFPRNERSINSVKTLMGLAQGGYNAARTIDVNPEDWK